MTRRKATTPPPLPTEEDVLRFVERSEGRVGKREIARAFEIRGGDRIALKRLLAEMSRKGLLAGNRRELRPKSGLPAVAVLDIVSRDGNGDLVAEPVVWDSDDGPRPRALIAGETGRQKTETASLGVGDRVLARIAPSDAGDDVPPYTATPIRKLPRETRRQVGIYRAHTRGGVIDPIDRKEMRTWRIDLGDQGEAKDGDLVRFELGRAGRFSAPRARVVEVLGNPRDQRQISLIAVHSLGLPDEFPSAVLAEAGALAHFEADGRTSLLDVPLLTIDPADARDHDDAVAATPDTDPRNPGGHIVWVAIADVAHYVRPGTRLDREAERRGNSIYFPDRVVPMLPERISNDLCSLREKEERPCLAVRMVFDRTGEKRSHAFSRAVMRSAAKLSYEEAQAAFDGRPGPKAEPLLERALKPLLAAYEALARARDRRAPLDLNLPERKIKLDAAGRVERVVVPERLTAHRLIEEMMIQANVAAAETLEEKRLALVYRVHDQPTQEKLKALREFLDTLELKLPGAGGLTPAHFNRVLDAARALPVADLVNEVVLRAQAQAEYTPANIGHFGLNLRRYAHFTSPIRRYADLLVHRALIRALGFGDDGITDGELQRLGEIARAISEAERRAMAAERETADRLIAAFLADRVGATFSARVSGVTKSGLFVRLADTGADGFVPAATLGDDFYRFDEAVLALIGDRTGVGWRLGDRVEVRLAEAVPSAGALRFEMVSDPTKMPGELHRGGRGRHIRGPKPRRGPPRRR